jgi:hypothetical protein
MQVRWCCAQLTTLETHSTFESWNVGCFRNLLLQHGCFIRTVSLCAEVLCHIFDMQCVCTCLHFIVDHVCTLMADILKICNINSLKFLYYHFHLLLQFSAINVL